jgi:hypothetical protein
MVNGGDLGFEADLFKAADSLAADALQTGRKVAASHGGFLPQADVRTDRHSGGRAFSRNSRNFFSPIREV